MPKFSDFEVANAGEVLKRLRELAETQEATYAEALGAHAGIQRVQAWLDAWAIASDEQARGFEIGYVRRSRHLKHEAGWDKRPKPSPAALNSWGSVRRGSLSPGVITDIGLWGCPWPSAQAVILQLYDQ
jgi:hypothetical protein